MKTILFGLVVSLALLGCGKEQEPTAKSVPEKQPAAVAAVPAADVAAGKDLAEKTCKSCHGLDGKGAGPAIPHLAAQRESSLVASLKEYKEGKRTHSGLPDIVTKMSDPGELATFALPSAYGFGEGTYVGDMPFTNFPHYLGVLTLLGAAAALCFLRGRFLVFLVVLFVFALGTSFVKHMPLLYDLLYAHLPYFNKFRVPVMILVLCQLAAAIAAGLGVAALLGETPRLLERRIPVTPRTLRRVVVITLVGAGLLLLAGLARSSWVASRVEASPRLPASARSAYAAVARDLVRGDGLRVALLLALEAGLVWAWVRRRLPLDLDIHLNGSHSIGGPCHLKIHVANVILIS